MTTKVSAIQMVSTENVQDNLVVTAEYIKKAAYEGSRLVVLPENFAIIGKTTQDKVHVKENFGQGPIQDFLAEKAAQYGIWLVGGTIPLVANDENKVRAACLVYNDAGELAGRYDKIHLFDVTLQDGNECYKESETIEAGNQPLVIKTPFGCLGVGVCYDLRFPEQFRQMLDLGMDILALPSAFTAYTGRSHWKVLLRARAIENLCYVIASAQGGRHPDGRETYGNSMVLDPWGNVMAQYAMGNGLVSAEISRHRVQSIRNNLPALSHRQIYCASKVDEI